MPLLFRGLSLDPASVDSACEAIRQTGRLADGSWWANTMADPEEVRLRRKSLAAAPAEIGDSISALPQTPLTYACGDFDGAAFYAVRAASGVPVVIEFEAPWEALCVDGKDFLYTTFQLWDRDGSGHRLRVRSTLASMFGSAVLSYFDAASAESDTMTRIGLCDLAVHDLDVIRAHYENNAEIHGRSMTRFRSAFHLPDCVPPTAIISVGPISERGSVGSSVEIMTLDSILAGD